MNMKGVALIHPLPTLTLNPPFRVSVVGGKIGL